MTPTVVSTAEAEGWGVGCKLHERPSRVLLICSEAMSMKGNIQTTGWFHIRGASLGCCLLQGQCNGGEERGEGGGGTNEDRIFHGTIVNLPRFTLFT